MNNDLACRVLEERILVNVGAHVRGFGGNFFHIYLDQSSNPIPRVLRPEFNSDFLSDTSRSYLIPKYGTIKNKHN